MDKWIMKQEDDDFFMGVLQEGDRLHPRDINGPYVKSEDVNLILAERDSLAAENAELKEDAIRDAGIECDLKADLAAANATLDRLREAMPEGGTASMLDALIIIGNFYSILYPPETTNDDRRDQGAERAMQEAPRKTTGARSLDPGGGKA